jgi:TolB-like protein/DNA-binding SARP family transcriptional activator
VITTSGVTAAPPRFRLQTFGTLRLTHSSDETALGDHGHQRRRLALLAVLAASGEQGRSRDQLLGLFWPEVSQPRARHSFDQLLYALRTSLDANLFAGGNPVHLNAAVINSDVADFSSALARGELDTAIALYRGPFLDGFYLSDAPAFEQWMEAERARVERSYTDALERLAKSLEDANDPSSVASVLHKLIDTDPVSSKHAIGLIRALMNAGDHASALRYAERYEAIVARELGTGVGPAVAALVAEVRARAKTESVVVRGVASRATAQAVGATTSPAPHVTEAPQPNNPGTHDPAPAPVSKRLVVRRRMAVRYGIPALVFAALVAIALWLRPRAASSAPTTTAITAASIAVLPLANHSGDPGDATLADGMTEELIARLAQITSLRVIASTSVFALPSRGMDVRRIADTLRVAHVLEGSLQKSGSRLRVQVRLLDARDAATIWSETYDRELRDVFAVEDDIARAVVRELGLRLGATTAASVRRQPTRNVAAYELYVRGSDRTIIRSDSGARKGIELFRQAIALDSTYAAAWAGLGRLYGRMSSTGPMRDRAPYYALAEEAARKALVLDDSLAEAHATLGALRLQSLDFKAAEQHLTRAIALDPGGVFPHERMVSLLLWTGRPTEALAHAERALALDPLAPDAHAEVAHALLGNNRCDEALAHLEKLSGLRPPLLRAAPISAQCYARERRWPEAIAVLRPSAERGEATPLALFGFMLARGGQKAEARRVRDTLLAGWRRGDVGAFWIAPVFAGLGERDAACGWLDRSVADGSLNGAARDIIIGPLFDDMRRDPCFTHLEQLSVRKP